jgi:molecular chaperone IbpA
VRTYDVAPLLRSTIGFDRLFDMLDTSARPEWPPYNIERVSEHAYRISMALAGFGPDDVELVQQGNTLTVSGQKNPTQDPREMLHQGLAHRGFRQTFNLADHMKVAGANLEHGMLSIELVRELPEPLKPRRIEIGSAFTAGSVQDTQPKLVEQSKAA